MIGLGISGAEVSWSVQGNAVILRVCMIRCMHGEQDGEGMCRSSMERVLSSMEGLGISIESAGEISELGFMAYE